jgi:hypothetical protein
MRTSAFVLVFAIVIGGLLVPDAKAQCYPGSYYTPPTYYYSAPPVYYTSPTYYTAPASDTECVHFYGSIYSKKYITAIIDDGKRITVPVINGYMPSIDLKKMTDGSTQRNYYYDECFKHNGESYVNYSVGGKSVAKKKPPTVTESYDDYPLKKPGVGISESSSFDRPPIITIERSFDKPKVSEFVTPGPVEDKLPPKKIEMPRPDPEVKALKENVTALQESIKELKALVERQQAELTKAKAPVVVAPEPKKVEVPSPMKKPSEFDKEPKK